MLFITKRALAIILAAVMLALFGAGAQTLAQISSHQSAGAVASSNTVAQLTGKERLGEKWKDEQRIDNCKVPLTNAAPSRDPTAARMCPQVDRQHFRVLLQIRTHQSEVPSFNWRRSPHRSVPVRLARDQARGRQGFSQDRAN